MVHALQLIWTANDTGADLIDERTKHIADAAAIAGGSVASLAQWSDFAGQVTPILSMIFVILSIFWLLLRIMGWFGIGPGAAEGGD